MIWSVLPLVLQFCQPPQSIFVSSLSLYKLCFLCITAGRTRKRWSTTSCWTERSDTPAVRTRICHLEMTSVKTVNLFDGLTQQQQNKNLNYESKSYISPLNFAFNVLKYSILCPPRPTQEARGLSYVDTSRTLSSREEEPGGPQCHRTGVSHPTSQGTGH